MSLTERVKARLTSKESWVLPKEESCIAPEGVWSNKGRFFPSPRLFAPIKRPWLCPSYGTDMDPSPPDYRVWTTYTFLTYWISDLVYPATWATVASFLTLGLTWWESCLAIFVGGVLAALAITGKSKPRLLSILHRGKEPIHSQRYRRGDRAHALRRDLAFDLRILG